MIIIYGFSLSLPLLRGVAILPAFAYDYFAVASDQNAIKTQANKMSAAATKLSSIFTAGLSTSVIFQMRFTEPINDSGEDITTFSDFSLLMFLVYL